MTRPPLSAMINKVYTGILYFPRKHRSTAMGMSWEVTLLLVAVALCPLMCNAGRMKGEAHLLYLHGDSLISTLSKHRKNILLQGKYNQ